MKNLGRIFVITFLFSYSAYANVTAYVDSQNVAYGDVVTYNLDISGNDAQKPTIYNLCGENVVSTASSTSIQNVNGNYSKKYILSYKFMAKKSCKIEPVSVVVGGKTFNTQPIDITVSKAATKKDDDFSLELISDKKEVYVGEPFEVTLIFKQKRAVRAVDNKFTPPTFSGFWVKGDPKEQSSQDSLYTTTKVTYKLAPQREGELKIDPAQISLAFRHRGTNFFGGFMDEVRWKNYFSNELNIQAKPLPVQTNLIGDFSITANVNKAQVNANEAVNLTLTVKGNGNLEDIKSFKPYINGVSVFDENIIIKEDVLTQKIAFVADESYTIPEFTLEYFNLATQEVQTIKTQAIPINVLNAKAKEELHVEKADVITEKKDEVIIEKQIDKLYLGVALAIGIFLGILIMLLKDFKFKAKKKKINIKDYKALLPKLLPFVSMDADVQKIVDIIENNSYSDTKEVIDIKLLKQLIKKYNIE